MRKAILAALLALWAGIAVAQDRPFRTIQSSQDPTGPLGLLTNLNGGQEIDLINAPTTASQSFALYQTGNNNTRILLYTIGPSGAIFNVPVTAIGPVTSQSGTTYTFAATDCGTEVLFTASSPITATIPATLPAGCNIAVAQMGAGKVSFNGSAVTPATLQSAHSYISTSAQYAVVGVNIPTNSGGSSAVAILTGDGSTQQGLLPTVQVQFVPGQAFPSQVLLTRASTATYFDSTGTIQTSAINTPRYDYDPVSLEFNGLEIEGPTTNVLLNSLLNGTSLTTQSVTVAAQQYTLSFYGSGTVTLSGAFAGTVYGSAITNERSSLTFTPTAGSLTLTVAGTVKWAQLEAGFIPSSFVPTAGVAVTRSEDFVSFTGPALSILGASQGSAVVSLRKRVNFAAAAIIGPDNVTNARYLNDFSSGQNTLGVNNFGGNNFLNSGLALTPNRPQRTGMTWNGQNCSAVVDGYTVVNATAPNAFAASTNYYLGSTASGAFGVNLFGWVTEVDLYNTAISNSNLQQFTSLPAPASIGSAVPLGASGLGYNKNVISINPAVSDIAPVNNASGYALADVVYFQTSTPANPGAFSMTNGVLTIPFNNEVLTQKQNSTQGALPYLSGATGFYIEFDVWLSDNNPDHWPAVWTLAQEHNLAQSDIYTGPPFNDPAGYERWMELDVDEGGFGKDTLSSVIDWQGQFDPGTSQYWRNPPTNTIPGNVTTNLGPLGYFDRTQRHTFGASYSPNEGATGIVRWYLDNREIFKASAPLVAKQQHFYMIAGAQSHGANTNYNMFLSRMRAYTP